MMTVPRTILLVSVITPLCLSPHSDGAERGLSPEFLRATIHQEVATQGVPYTKPVIQEVMTPKGVAIVHNLNYLFDFYPETQELVTPDEVTPLDIGGH